MIDRCPNNALPESIQPGLATAARGQPDRGHRQTEQNQRRRLRNRGERQVIHVQGLRKRRLTTAVKLESDLIRAAGRVEGAGVGMEDARIAQVQAVMRITGSQRQIVPKPSGWRRTECAGLAAGEIWTQPGLNVKKHAAPVCFGIKRESVIAEIRAGVAHCYFMLVLSTYAGKIVSVGGGRVLRLP